MVCLSEMSVMVCLSDLFVKSEYSVCLSAKSAMAYLSDLTAMVYLSVKSAKIARSDSAYLFDHPIPVHHSMSAQLNYL